MEVNSGLEGVLAAETTISLVDGQAGRLLYRGYEIGDLAAHGSYDRVVGLLLDGEWPAGDDVLPAAELTPPVLAALRGLPTSCAPLDALRTGFSAFGAERRMDWPPTADQARELIALAPSVVGAFARLRDGREPVAAAGGAHLGVAGRLLYAISGEQPDAAKARALDAYFTACAEHGLNASTLHRPRDHEHAERPGERRLRRRGSPQGPAARRRAVGGARPVDPDRRRRSRRGLDP